MFLQAILSDRDGSMISKKTIRDINVEGRRVLVRVDFNAPMDNRGNITDDTKILGALPTIKYLIEHNAKLILCAHMGRPKGVEPSLSLEPAAKLLSAKLMGKEVKFVKDCIGPEAEAAAAALQPGEVMMLENLRFHADEEKNGGAFARSLAYLAEMYVNDAFGTAHRAHASTVGVTKFLPAVAGFLLEKEVENLGKLLNNPVKPFAAVLGGSKVSDKMKVVENLLNKLDYCMIGGGMAATFLKAAGHKVGASQTEDDQMDYVRNLTNRMDGKGAKILMPADVVVAQAFSESAPHKNVNVNAIPDGWLIMDIGPKTAGHYADAIGKCKTVVWNGPVGVFEMPQFSAGTDRICRAMAALGPDAVTVVGGGSTAEAMNKLGLADKVTHVSTGGGASLEFLEGKTLPGVEALQNK